MGFASFQQRWRVTQCDSANLRSPKVHSLRNFKNATRPLRVDVPFQFGFGNAPNRPTRLADGLGLESAPIHSRESAPLNCHGPASKHAGAAQSWQIGVGICANSL